MANIYVDKCKCGGELEYDKETKRWICKYCGTIVEREATFDKVKIDGIEGIDDVVRQTLMDIAHLRADNAYKNLESCERKDRSHIGTIFGEICFYFMKGKEAKTIDEANAAKNKIAIYTRELKSDYSSITPREINMYESFGEHASEIFASLVVVFSRISEKERIDFIINKIKVKEIFSADVNYDLLCYMLSANNKEFIRQICSNIGIIDRKRTFKIMLSKYSGDDKIDICLKLINNKMVEELSKEELVDIYETDKLDISEKLILVSKLIEHGAKFDCEELVAKLLPKVMDEEMAKQLFRILFASNISSSQVDMLLKYMSEEDTAIFYIKSLLYVMKEVNYFYIMSDRLVTRILENDRIEKGKKKCIVQTMIQVKMEEKSIDKICNFYLNNCIDQNDFEFREQIISLLIDNGGEISPETIRKYVVCCDCDKERKENIIEILLKSNTNSSYYSNIISEYIIKSKDSENIKEKIVEYLINKGFKFSTKDFDEYLLFVQDNKDLKLKVLREMIKQGISPMSDSLDKYISSIKGKEDYSIEIFDALIKNCYVISFESLSKYIIEIVEPNKVINSQVLITKFGSTINNQRKMINYFDKKICCNILQAYVLSNSDDDTTMIQMVELLKNNKLKLGDNIEIDRVTIKFKKFIQDNKDVISEKIYQICNENKIFSLF